MQSPSTDEFGAGDAWWKALAQNAATVVWNTAADGSASSRNPSWEAFTGQSYDEYSGWGWTTAIHPDDRAAMTEAWVAATGAGKLFQHTYRLRRHDGAYRHVRAQGTPIASGWVGVCIDVTEALQAEQALQESELRFRFLDRLGQATRELTEAGDVMAATARMLGEYLGCTRCAYADVEADGDRFTIRSDWSVPGVPSSAGVYSLELFGPQATSNLRRGRHLVVRDVDRELGDSGGGRMFNAIGIKAVICAGLVKEGRLVAMMAVHQSQPRDWTAQEIALVSEVVDRCWAHIERVRDSALLREQDRRKDHFLATLAHELRNPLAPVRYALALLRRAPTPEQRGRAQDVIDRQVSHMARLIDDLLDLSRVSRGLIRLQPQPLKLADVLRDGVEVARPALEEARHAVDLQLPPDGVLVQADAARLVQVVGNLVGNAAKYTPEGGRIVVRAHADGGHVEIEVADNGVGFAPEDQDKLFQMFSQLPHSTDRARGGLGIGLSLVKTLVEMHGGTVSARSAGLGRGSQFIVRLPRLAERPVLVTEGAGPPAADSGPDDPKRILVVEDNEDGRATLVALLQHWGHEVAEAADGARALDVAKRFEPELVLLDLGLPVMDGLEVCRRMRADDKLKKAYILALTGWGSEADRLRTREAGFDRHLTKPVEADALLASLAAVPAPGRAA
jgi:PAS domain S-box-containing protein